MTVHGPPSVPIILCCEDETALRRDIADELSEAGYQVLEAADGLEAWELLTAHRPDMILCDITMPRLNGQKLLDRVLRDRPDLADVPFIFLTALSEPHDIVEGKRAGADDYLVKPLNYDLLLATVEARLRQVVRWRKQQSTALDITRQALRRPVDAAAFSVLDHLTLGVVVLDQDMSVIHVNPAAQMLGKSHSGIELNGNLGGAPELRPVLQAACTAAAAGQDHSAALSLSCPAGGSNLIIMVSALPQSDDPQGPAVLLMLSDPRRPALPSTAVLAQLFGLTATEAQMSRLLAGGMRRPEIAADMEISQTTVAFHMRNVFLKTGTNRQADLIVLLLAAPTIHLRFPV